MYKIIFLLAAQLVSAATYYVSPTGNDSNVGTQVAPFRHLSKAASVARSPGDVVIALNGTYDNEGVVAPNYVVTLQFSGALGNPITFKAQNRGQAILDSMNTSTTVNCNGASAYFNLYNAAYIVIEGFTIQHSCDSGVQSNDNAHDVLFHWNDFRNIAQHTVTDQFGRDGIYLNSNEYNFTFDGNAFHDIGRTDGQAQLHFDHGIYGSAKNIRVTNNLFFNLNRGYAIQLAAGATNWFIANNTFAFNNAPGEAAPIMWWNNSSSITVRNNIFYNPLSAALMSLNMTTTNSFFDHNLIFGTSTVMSGSSTGIIISTNQTGNDPKFVDVANVNFNLQDKSPAINAGVIVSGVTADYAGNVRSTNDIGAYQFVPPPVIVPTVNKCDKNKDGVVNKQDVLLMLTWNLETALGQAAPASCDADGNGTCDVQDLMIISAAVAGQTCTAK